MTRRNTIRDELHQNDTHTQPLEFRLCSMDLKRTKNLKDILKRLSESCFAERRLKDV